MCAISINSYNWDWSESEGKRPKPTPLPHMRLWLVQFAGQMIQFGTIKFRRTFENYFGQFVWIEKKHFKSRFTS